MAEDFDTSWFDLKKYEGFNDLDMFGWYEQISIRNLIQNILHSDLPFEVSHWVNRIKENPIIPTGFNKKSWVSPEMPGLRRYSFNTYSVNSPTVMDICSLRSSYRINRAWKIAEKVAASGGVYKNKKGAELCNTPIGLLCSSLDRIDALQNTYITIDLTASDEQIKKDFNHWLAEYRRHIDYNAEVKIFTEKQLSNWIKLRLMPYIDLVIFAEVEGKEITQVNLGRMIFPDEYEVDLTEKIRRTVKPNAKWLIKDETVAVMEAQLRSEAATLKK